MSRQNLALVRSIYRAWERGDFSSAVWAHPDIEFGFGDGPAAGSVRGLTAMAEGFGDYLSTWEDWRVEAHEYRELDREHVLVRHNVSARGKASSLEVGQMSAKEAGLFQLRDGKVTRLLFYWEYERALADLGLVPEAGDHR
jgi:ketosteroid isomerase-like protein